jgi:hypothetical protein
MKLILSIIVCLLFSSFIYSQSRPNFQDSLTKCSWVIKEVSYFWILDSLANNGYRRCAVSRILESKLDKISKSFLLEKLGKPNRISEKFDGRIEYIYYYFDIMAMPKNYEAPMGTGYISFLFRRNEDWVSFRTEGDIDR